MELLQVEQFYFELIGHILDFKGFSGSDATYLKYTWYCLDYLVLFCWIMQRKLFFLPFCKLKFTI